DLDYYTSIIVGNQEFRVLLDTGSSNLWIPNSNCTSCQNERKFDSSKSPTFKPEGKDWEIAYGSGFASGVTEKDNIQIANLTAFEQIFGLADSIDDSFNDLECDGILGLGFDQLNTMDDGTPTFISTLIKQKTIAPIFSFHFQHVNASGDKGTFTLGGVDESKFKGNITFTPVIDSDEYEGFWVVSLKGANVNNNPLEFSREAIIDTGTTILIIPNDDAEAIFKQIPGSTYDQIGAYIIPCNTSDVVSLKFGGVNYEIPSKDLILDKISETDCTSSILPGGDPSWDFWLVGQTFLKNVYSAFDAEKKQVGFAT
ncbi:aspartic peptidase domain-containing protein, partial [Gigaspora rosea]